MGGFAGLFAVLLTIFAIAFAVALGVLFLGVIVRVLGVLFRAIFGAIAIVLGAAADLVVATFALLPLLIHAGVALALVVFGQWPGAQRRAAGRTGAMGPQGNRRHRQPGCHPVGAGPAQDPFRQDHAPHPAEDRRERGGPAGRHLDPRRSGGGEGSGRQPGRCVAIRPGRFYLEQDSNITRAFV